MLIYGVKISDIKKYNEQKAERFFEILQKTNASNIAEKYFLDKTKNDGTFGDFLSNFDDGCGNYGAAACQMCIRDRYRLQGFSMFNAMNDNIQEDTVQLLYQVAPVIHDN